MATKSKPTPPTILNDDDQSPVILASSIRRVADSAERLLGSGLTMRALLVLLKDKTGLPMADIEKVLLAAKDLRTFTFTLKAKP